MVNLVTNNSLRHVLYWKYFFISIKHYSQKMFVRGTLFLKNAQFATSKTCAYCLGSRHLQHIKKFRYFKETHFSINRLFDPLEQCAPVCENYELNIFGNKPPKIL